MLMPRAASPRACMPVLLMAMPLILLSAFDVYAFAFFVTLSSMPPPPGAAAVDHYHHFAHSQRPGLECREACRFCFLFYAGARARASQVCVRAQVRAAEAQKGWEGRHSAAVACRAALF